MSSNGAPTALDRYLLEVSGKFTPLVCFAPTAAADDRTYVNRFLNAYGTLGVRTMILTLWQGAAAAVERLHEADIVVVGGGSTLNLLALWKAHGVDIALKQMMKSHDLVVGGLSAGAACWFEGCVTDSYGDYRGYRGGLGVLEGSLCPHFDSEGERTAVFTDAIASGMLPSGYGVPDGVALHFTDGQFIKAVSEVDDRVALHILANSEPTSSGVATEVIHPERL